MHKYLTMKSMDKTDQTLLLSVLNCLDSCAFILNSDGQVECANDAAYSFLPGLIVKSVLETYFPADAASEHSVLRKLFLESPEKQKLEFELEAEAHFPSLSCSINKIEMYGKSHLLELISKHSGSDPLSSNLDLDGTDSQDLYTKGDFVMGALHDLKGHLHGSNRLLRQICDQDFGGIEPGQEHVLEKLISANNRVLLLMQNLINHLTLDGSKSSFEMQELNLSEFLRSVLDLSFYRIDQCLISEALFVQAHPPSIQSLLFNLLDNAEKFGGHESRIHVELINAGGFAVISVKNTNSILTAAECKMVFEKHWQRDRAVSSSGFGLGLYLCRLIAAKHGAEISCRSAGKATEFCFRVPLLCCS